MTPPLRIFPPGLVGGDGRRIRLGSRVSVEWEGQLIVGEVVGWAGVRGVEVIFDDEPVLLTVPAIELLRVDEDHPNPVTLGWQVVEDDDTPTVVLCTLGDRDMVWRDRDSRGPFAGVTAEPRSVRLWCQQMNECCAALGDAAASAVFAHVDMPMLRRVLDEASLPDEVLRLSLVLTDQVEPQQRDTAELPRIVELWLRGRGHLTADAAESEARPIAEFGPHVVVRRLPHQLDAVIHQVVPQLATVVSGAERVVSVLAGGVPATKYAMLLAASAVAGSDKVRSVQVPEAFEVNGERVEQPLIELDLDQTALGQA